MNSGWKKVLMSVLLLLLGSALELKIKAALGWSFDLMLIALLLPVFFLDIPGTLFFAAFSAWLFKTIYPFSALEAGTMAGLFILVFILKRSFPWQSWLKPFASVVLGILVFYGVANSKIFSEPGLLFADLAVSSVFAWVSFAMLSTGKNER